MRLKRISLAIICMLTFLIINPTAITVAETDIPEIPKEEPNLIIAEDRHMPVFKAGEKANFSVPIENTSSTTVKDLFISLNVNDLNSFPFELNKMSLSKHISYFSGNNRSLISFDMMVPANKKPGVYPINISLTYKSEAGIGSTSATIYVKIVNEFKQPILKLMNVSYEGDRLPAGKSSIVKLNIKNDSDLSLKDIELHLSGFTANGINMDNWPDTQYIKSISPGQLKPVEFKFYIDPDIEKGTHTLDLSMKYKDEYDQEYTRESKVFLPVNGKGDTDALTPRIIIENYYFPGEYVKAGETFPLTLYFINTNETKTVKNIKISLSSDESIFSPVGNSNSFYIKQMEPGEAFERTVSFKAKVDAEQNTYNITADIDYQDADGNKLNEKELISIPVIQDLKLVTSEVIVPLEAYIGTPAALSLDFYNTGRSIIRNLMIRTEGDFEIQDGATFIGNVEPGKDDYYDVTIIPQKEGTLSGKIILEYDDVIGEHHQTEKTFKINVTVPPEPPAEEPMPGEEEPSTSRFKPWMIAPAAGILLLIGYIIYRKRRKKKEEVELDE